MRRKKIKLLLLVFFCLALIGSVSVRVRAEGMIRIDTNKKYKGMNTSFAKGYVPVIRKNTLQLVVPFLAEESVESDSLLVGVSFEREENSPFYFKNYQKSVKQSKNGVFLYQCKIKLKKERINGQYPLNLFVLARTAGEMIRQDFTIYVEITDGRDVSNDGAYIPVENEGAEMQQSETASEIQDSKEEVIHQPRILINQNSFQGTSIQAGENSFWTLSAKNCSSSQPIENMKVTLLSDNRDILFEKNAWYFDKIAAGTAMDLSQNVTVGKKALAESVPIQFQFDYEDQKGNIYSSTETLYLSVRQVQQAELVNLSVPESMYESDTEPVTFEIQNTGLAVIYNARVRLEGRGLFADEVFLGNIEAGALKDGEMQVFAGTLDMDDHGEISDENGEKYGDTFGRVIFLYENEQGEIVECEQEFSTAIKKPQVVELKIEEEQQETNQWWITIVALVILVLILIIIWLYLRMKYYQKMRREIYGQT